MDCDERLDYVDFLLDSFSLKHLDRKPLNLTRIPDHLCIKIAAQQSLLSSLNLARANSRYSNLVNTTVLQNPYAQFIYQLFQDYNKSSLFPWGWFDNISAFEEGTRHMYADLNCWIWIAFRNIRYCQRLWRDDKTIVEKLIELELSLRYIQYRPVRDLWGRQQLLGPRRICLRSVSDEIWKKILPKATAAAATRLARTRSTMAVLLDNYIQTTMPVRVMVEAERRTLPNKDRWEYETNRNNYYKMSLFRNAIHLQYGSRGSIAQADSAVISQLNHNWYSGRRSFDQGKMKHWQKSLGHGSRLHNIYYADRRPPKPGYSDSSIEIDIFLRMYGDSLE